MLFYLVRIGSYESCHNRRPRARNPHSLCSFFLACFFYDIEIIDERFAIWLMEAVLASLRQEFNIGSVERNGN